MPSDFDGRTVVCFQSRRADDMIQLVRRCGGRPISAPTMREVALDSNTAALAFADRLFAGAIDMVVFLTGVGTQVLDASIATRHPPTRFAEALKGIITVARGPKPAAVLRKLGVKATINVPEPNTWEDVLAALDGAQHPIAGQHVAVQEYGRSNVKLLDGLRQRGADVIAVPVYRWGLPEDLGPLRDAIAQIVAGKVDIVLVTTATQVDHLFRVAESDGSATALRDAMRRTVIGSVGPVASDAVRGHGMTVDHEPDGPHMSHLVHDMARLGGRLLHRKRTADDGGIDTNRWRRVDMVWPSAADTTTAVPARSDSVLLKACRREPTPYTPIWLMRQAGRYQRSYRKVRAGVSMLELCQTPDLAAEVTLAAVDELGVDAAIIFADILLVLEPLGLKLSFVSGAGPVVDGPVRTRGDVERLAEPDVGELGYVYDAIRLVRRALRPDVALIGFAGAPFTIASYMIEGGKSAHYLNTKTLMYSDPSTWDTLMQRMTGLLIAYLNAQIEAGADVVQLFDSWVGALCPDDYRRFVLPHVRRLIDGVDRRAPLIHFATGNPALLPLLKEAGGDVIGLDWRVDLADAWRSLGDDVAVMGNLDPIVLHASPATIRERAAAILDAAGGRPGHIFNLGHGILPTTPPERAVELVEAVHELSAR